MKIWAHRGCSQMYPENTVTAFAKAMEIKGITGIELDIQMTKDGEIVVIHDERVDRTTNGTGNVKDFTYSQLRGLTIETGKKQKERIPSIIEVLDLLQGKMEEGMFLNIELKNSNIPYEGMEKRIISLLGQYGTNIKKQVVYSSFYTESLEKIRGLESDASIGILDMKVSDCLDKKRNYCKTGILEEKIALHPFWRNMDISKEQLAGQTVRAWFGGHLYPGKPTGTRLDLMELDNMGITDVFLNEPEAYLE